MQSKFWNMTDNVYVQSRMNQVSSNTDKTTFNDGVMCIFQSTFDGSVNGCIREYLKTHTRNETLGFNNKLFMSITNPTDKHKAQYNANRDWILKQFHMVNSK